MPNLRFVALSSFAFTLASLAALAPDARAAEPSGAPAAPGGSAGPAVSAAPAAEASADASGDHLRSLELTLRPSLGNVGASSPLHVAPGARVVGDVPAVLGGGASPYGSSAGVGAAIGFRFHPLFSMGLRADLATVSASAPDDGTTDLSRSRQSAGLYARAYPLALSAAVRRWIDPWVSAGVSYVHDGQSFHHPAATSRGTTVDGTWSLDEHAIGVPLAVGVDYRVTRAISIGPSFEYTLLAPIAGCAKLSAAGFQDTRFCTDNTGPQALVADGAGSWNVGLDLRVTPF
jgi:opacity protein-like surface antigen